MMTASGTAGHGAELAPYFDLSSLGAVVVKSLAAFEWAGNPAPASTHAGVGDDQRGRPAGPGRAALAGRGAAGAAPPPGRVVAQHLGALASTTTGRRPTCSPPRPPEVVAVEVNLSCPNLEGRRGIFAHDAALSAEVIAATAGCGRPRWAKLSPNTDRVVEVAAAGATAAGAEAVTLINTLLGMVLDPRPLRPVLGAGGGGRAAAAVRSTRWPCGTIYDVHAALPGAADRRRRWGVATGWDAGRADAGRCQRGAGGHGHLRRPAGTRAAAGAARAGCVGALEAIGRGLPPSLMMIATV